MWDSVDSWIFDNFIIADELLTEALQSLNICVSATNNLCGKLVSILESQITFGNFSFLLLLYWVVNQTILHLKYYFESF